MVHGSMARDPDLREKEPTIGVSPARLGTIADFVIAVGSLMLSSGGAAAEVVRAMLTVAQKAGLESVSVDVTYSELAFSYRPQDDVPYTRIHTVWGRTFHYGKLTDVTDLVERFCLGDITLGEGEAEVRSLAVERGPYPWWLTRLAAGFAGANAALVFGSGWLVMVVAFLANVGLDYVAERLSRRDWFSFYTQALAGCTGVLAATVVYFIDPSAKSSQVVASVIIVMLAGMSSTGGVQDAITGWYLTAVGRIFEAIMNTVGLMVGVALGLLVTTRLGIDLSVSPDVLGGNLPLPVTVLASALVAVGFSFVAQNPPRVILPAAALAGIGYIAFEAGSGAHLGTAWSSAMAACVVGFIAIPCTQWFKAPGAAFGVCALLPLFPGLKLYQGLSAIARPGSYGGDTLITALTIALALAGGLTFGQYLGILSWRRLRPLTYQFFAPLFAKPFATSQRMPREPQG